MRNGGGDLIRMEEMLKMVSRMDPEDALVEISKVLKVLFSVLGEEARSQFLWELMGESKATRCPAWSISDWLNAWAKVSTQRKCVRAWWIRLPSQSN